MENAVDDFLNAGNETDTGAEDTTAAEEAAKIEAEKVAAEQAAAAKAAEEESAIARAKAFETKALDEVRKRQRLEEENRQLQEALAAKEPEDRDEYAESIKAAVRAEQEDALYRNRVIISQEMVREKYPDYDEKENIFIEMTKENPALSIQVRQVGSPAMFAYKTALNQQKLAEMGNPDEYEQKLKERITAEVEAKFKKQYETEAAMRESLPGTLANQRGVSGMQAQTWAGPTAIDDILK